MQHHAIQSELAPVPLAGAPYSQAIAFDQLIFTSGQLPLDPSTQQLVAGDITAQTRQALQNVAVVLEAGGSSLAHVLKTTVFLADLDDWPAMNDTYREIIASPAPARSAVEVRLPHGVLVEIEVIAYRPVTDD